MKRKSQTNWIVAGVAVVVGIGAVAYLATRGKIISNAPRITFTPNPVKVGYTGQVVLSGSNFTPNSALSITELGLTIQFGTSDASGSFSATFGSGSFMTVGSVLITITDAQGKSASATFVVSP